MPKKYIVAETWGKWKKSGMKKKGKPEGELNRKSERKRTYIHTHTNSE